MFPLNVRSSSSWLVLFIFCSVCLFVRMESPSKNHGQIVVEASADFALNLLNKNNHNGSFVFSPFSLGVALSILHAGAEGITKKEITDVLLKGQKSVYVTSHYKTVLRDLDRINRRSITIEVASLFFLDNLVTLKASYQKDVENQFKAYVEKYNFKDVEEAAAEVNQFVDSKTYGKIKKVVDPDVFINALAVLVNTVFFKGSWYSSFDRKKTKKDDFHAVGGGRKEDFMRANDVYVNLNPKNDDVQVCGLNYKNKNFTMWFFLPKEGHSLQSWLSGTNGKKLLDLIERSYRTKANLTIPKFKIESNLPAKRQLEELGVVTLFNNLANLSTLSTRPLQVKDIVHKAVIEVNEEGTEGAAASTATLFWRSAFGTNHVFNANRPFAFAITHLKNIIFMGTFQ